MKKYNFSQCRKNLGLTQKQVADHLNMSVSNYSKIEREETDVALSVFLKMAAFFRVSLIELVGEDRFFKALSPYELILHGEELISRGQRLLYKEVLERESEGLPVSQETYDLLYRHGRAGNLIEQEKPKK